MSVETAVRELVREGGLLDQLSALLPQGARVPQEGGTHQKVSGSPAPWNSAAAGIAMTIHAGARELESTLRYRIGLPARQRGGSDGNTREALRALPALLDLAPAHVRDEATRALLGWVGSAAVVAEAGQLAGWSPIPREPGAPPRACPHCGLFALRWSRTRGVVRCTSRTCREAGGSEWPVEEMLPTEG